MFDNKTNRTKGIILAIISSGSFGLIPFFSKPLLNMGMSPSSILLYRSFLALIILVIMCLVRRQNFRIPTKSIGMLAILGVFYSLTSFGLIFSYQYIDTGIATTIHFLYPVVVALLMFLFYKERISKVIILAALLSLIGVGMLSWNEGGMIATKGLLAALATVFTYAVYIVGFSNKELKKLPQDVSMVYVMGFGAVIFALITATTAKGFQPIDSLIIGFNLLGLAVIPTIISGLALITAVRYAGSTTTSVLGSFEPLVAMLLGVLYFNETFGWNCLCGMAIIILAVVIVIMYNNPASNKPQKTQKKLS